MDENFILPPVLLPLIVTAGVALIAFVTRSYAAFIVGTAACWVATGGRPVVRTAWRPGTTHEHMYLAEQHEVWQHYLNWVPISAVIGVVIGLVLSQLFSSRWNRPQDQAAAAPTTPVD